jgi:KDO2-lipid IV(A) lauroyltransferase
MISSAAFAFPSKRKANLRKNIEAVLGKDNVTDKMLRFTYKTYGRYYLDTFSGNVKFPERMIPDSYDAFKNNIVPAVNKFLSGGRGLIMVSVHLGNWDAAGAFAAHCFPGKVNIVVEKLSPAMFRWFSETRTKTGIKIIEHTNIKQMIRVLNNHEILILASDRDLEKNGFQMNFFNKKAYIPSGPAKLALMTNSPVLIGCFPRDEKDISMFRVKCRPQILNIESMPRTKENVEQLAKNIIMENEELIRQDPLQWCMLQEIFVKQ